MTPVTPQKWTNIKLNSFQCTLMICAAYEFLDEEWELMRPTCKWGKHHSQIWINIKLNSFLAAGVAR